MPSRRRLPPLNAVRAFEAAARHPTFERAGEELGVSAGAIAQQVKGLEAWLGVPLFQRLPSRGVALTSAGRRYAAALGEPLDQIAAASRRAMREAEGGVLTVSTIGSFALNWLVPRLGSLQRSHPELDVRVRISLALSDFARDDIDVAIRYGRGPYPELHAEQLLSETFFAVCSAALRDDPARPIREPADLRGHTLIHEDLDPNIPESITWARFLAHFGVTGLDASRGPRFSHTFLSLQAAAAGQGVAIATSVLIGDELSAGRLVRPFPHEIEGPYRYWFVCPPEALGRRPVAAFRRWLKEQTAAAEQP
jgi:LysR family transcriptional regulator, glycine cleavage system transcriptional activator